VVYSKVKKPCFTICAHPRCLPSFAIHYITSESLPARIPADCDHTHHTALAPVRPFSLPSLLFACPLHACIVKQKKKCHGGFTCLESFT